MYDTCGEDDWGSCPTSTIALTQATHDFAARIRLEQDVVKADCCARIDIAKLLRQQVNRRLAKGISDE